MTEISFFFVALRYKADDEFRYFFIDFWSICEISKKNYYRSLFLSGISRKSLFRIGKPSNDFCHRFKVSMVIFRLSKINIIGIVCK